MTLQQRLTFGVGLLLIISLIASTLTIIEAARNLYQQELVQQTRRAVALLSQQTIPLLRARSSVATDQENDRPDPLDNQFKAQSDREFTVSYQMLVEQIMGPNDYQVLSLFDSSGTELFRGQNVQQSRQDDYRHNFPTWLPQVLELINEPIVIDITDKWQRLGTLRVRPSMSQSYQGLWQHTKNNLLNLGWITLISFLLLYFSLYFLLRPLNRFRQQLNSMTDSDWQTRTGRYLSVDMAEIQSAINMTAERLQDLWSHQLNLIDQLHYHNYHDDLSGLLNRRGFDHRLEHLQQHHEGHHGLLMIVQINNLTHVNIEQGRRAGDDVIAGLGKLIQQWQQEHSGSFCGRHSATDITLYAPCSDANQAHDVIQQTFTQLSLASVFQQRNLTFHIGGLFYGDSSDQVTSLLSKTDAALKIAQEHSGARHYLTLDSPVMEEGLTPQQWQDLLHVAVKEPSLQLRYQPILSMNADQDTDDNVRYYQVLPSLIGPRGELSAAGFWPLVEHHRLTVEFDLCVINLVLQSLRDRVASMKPDTQLSPFCINVSPASLVDERFYQQLTILLRRCRDVSSYLIFEVPEFCINQYQSSVIRLSDLAKAYGISIGIDHVTHIQALQLSQIVDLAFLKIDSRYCRHIYQLSEQRIMVQSIIQAARYRQLTVLMDGVNNQLDYDSLKDLGLDGCSGKVIADAQE